MAGKCRPLWLLLFLLSSALFLGGLGRIPLLGRDESLYAEAAREMAASGDWVTPRVNGGPFLEKPPLYYWMGGASVKLFGASPLAVRLPAALMALLATMLTAAIGARVWGPRAGLLAGLALATCLQMVVIGRMGIMDAPLTCLCLLSMLAYARWQARGEIVGAVGFGGCVALGVLLKGMAGVIPLNIAVIHQLVLIVLHRGRAAGWASVGRAILAVMVLVGLAAPWFVIMARRHGEQFASTLLWHEHVERALRPMQGHGGAFWVYLWVYVPLILLGFFPWVMFVPAGMAARSERDNGKGAWWRRLCLVWTGYVLVLFSCVSTKLPGYVTPLYPPMALLAGAELDRRLGRPGRAPWVAVMVGGVGLAALAALLPTLVGPLARRAGVQAAVGQLTPGVMAWAAACLVIAAGGALAVGGASRPGLGLIAGGQMAAAGAVVIGILPVVSAHLEGGREYLLARRARVVEEAGGLPGAALAAVYETRPEAVAFALERPVAVFGEERRGELVAQLLGRARAGRRSLLIAPAGELAGFAPLQPQEVARLGDRALLEIPANEHTATVQ